MTDRFNQESHARQIIADYNADPQDPLLCPSLAWEIETIRNGASVTLPASAWCAGWGDLLYAVVKLELERRDG